MVVGEEGVIPNKNLASVWGWLVGQVCRCHVSGLCCVCVCCLCKDGGQTFANKIDPPLFLVNFPKK